MASIATLTNIDVATRNLQRSVNAHVGCVLDSLMNREQRRDLDSAADARNADDGEQESDGLAFEPIVNAEHTIHSPGCRAGMPRSRG